MKPSSLSLLCILQSKEATEPTSHPSSHAFFPTDTSYEVLIYLQSSRGNLCLTCHLSREAMHFRELTSTVLRFRISFSSWFYFFCFLFFFSPETGFFLAVLEFTL